MQITVVSQHVADHEEAELMRHDTLDAEHTDLELEASAARQLEQERQEALVRQQAAKMAAGAASCVATAAATSVHGVVARLEDMFRVARVRSGAAAAAAIGAAAWAHIRATDAMAFTREMDARQREVDRVSRIAVGAAYEAAATAAKAAASEPLEVPT